MENFSKDAKIASADMYFALLKIGLSPKDATAKANEENNLARKAALGYQGVVIQFGDVFDPTWK